MNEKKADQNWENWVKSEFYIFLIDGLIPLFICLVSFLDILKTSNSFSSEIEWKLYSIINENGASL